MKGEGRDHTSFHTDSMCTNWMQVVNAVHCVDHRDSVTVYLTHHAWKDNGVGVVPVELGQLAGCHVEPEGDGVEGVSLLHRVLHSIGGPLLATERS